MGTSVPDKDDQPTRFQRDLAAARAGDREALERLLEPFRAFLLGVASPRVSPDLLAKGEASDLVQETFTSATSDFGQFQGQTPEQFRGWLRGILEHIAQNFRRKYRGKGRDVRREVPLSAQEDPTEVNGPVRNGEPSPRMEAMRREAAAALNAAIQRLPERSRAAILLRHLEGLSFVQIGERLECSADAARKLWRRALECLKLELPPGHDSALG